MIPQSKWKWFGNPGHFICSRWCRFHLTTQIGKYLVSTVGEYLPSEGAQAIMARSRGVTLTERGEALEDEYIRKLGYDDIGYQRKFETMVFIAGKPCDGECGCGLPAISGSELDFAGYNSVKDATAGHAAMCLKVANGKVADKESE